MDILVTGGAGFIGSHCCVDLLTHGFDVVVVDDYSNSSPMALERVEEISGRPVRRHELDIRDAAALRRVFESYDIHAVIHFAGRKAVGESVEIPLDYYETNVGGTLNVVRAMREHDVTRLVFSSSCSIYGDADEVPISEGTSARPTNPYARTKWMCEQILADLCAQDGRLAIAALRYFNPVGGHESGLLGEDPRGVPGNLMPYLAQVAVGRLDEVAVFGGDYPTMDGTGVRDYIHVMDVVEGHRSALAVLDAKRGFQAINLGTGTGTSVLQLIRAFTAAVGRDLPYRIVGRRPGDVAELVAAPGRAESELGWRARRDLHDMCRDAWRFQKLNPNGYEKTPDAGFALRQGMDPAWAGSTCA